MRVKKVRNPIKKLTSMKTHNINFSIVGVLLRKTITRKKIFVRLINHIKMMHTFSSSTYSHIKLTWSEQINRNIQLAIYFIIREKYCNSNVAKEERNKLKFFSFKVLWVENCLRISKARRNWYWPCGKTSWLRSGKQTILGKNFEIEMNFWVSLIFLID